MGGSAGCRWSRLLAAAAGVTLLLAACSTVEDSGAEDRVEEAVEEDVDDEVAAPPAEEPHAEPERPDDGTAGDGLAAADGDRVEVADLGELEQADEGRMLIREGSVQVGYPEDFAAAHRQIAAIAERLGGGVLEVDSRTDDDGITTGRVTVEVPADEYDQLLTDVGEVGEVAGHDIRTDDVTEEYVDLRSRLRHLERTEEFYLGLFDEADGVEDAIRIHDRLEGIQQRMEEIQGRLNRLEQRTAMSRLTVELAPEGHELDGEPVLAGFAGYWADARAAFVTVAGTLLVMVAGGAPLVLAGAAVLGMALLLLRAWRQDRSAEPPEPG